MTIEEWAAEMWRRAKDVRAGTCEGCPSKRSCNRLPYKFLCDLVVAAWHEAGVVPVVVAPERREGAGDSGAQNDHHSAAS